MRKLTVFLPVIYAALTAFTLAQLAQGQPFQVWLVILCPLVGFGFCLVHAVERLGLRRAVFFLGLTLMVSLFFESLGVATGWIYGSYHYAGNRLGPLFLGLVPYLIPLTWFMMLYPSYVIAERCTPLHWGGKRRGLVIAALPSIVCSPGIPFVIALPQRQAQMTGGGGRGGKPWRIMPEKSPSGATDWAFGLM